MFLQAFCDFLLNKGRDLIIECAEYYLLMNILRYYYKRSFTQPKI